MALRVTARRAQRLGTMAPSQGSSRTANRAVDRLDRGPVASAGTEPPVAGCCVSGGAGSAPLAGGRAARCRAKCSVRATVVPPAITASNCALVFSRCTAGAIEAAPRRPGGRSDGQALAALGAASVDDGAAATGLHADQEAVGAGAAHFGGLVGAFHGVVFPGNPGLSAIWPTPARKRLGVKPRNDGRAVS